MGEVLPGYPGNTTAGAFEWYRHDALGRRVLVRTRRDHSCNGEQFCTSEITRYVWDGDQILFEIRNAGGAVPSTTLENDRPTGIEHGSVLYTHGHKRDQPLDVIRMGHWSSAQQWGGPYPVHPIADWRGSFINGSDWEGRELPCGTGGCTIIWPMYSAFYVRQPATQTTFFGSLIWGKEDGSGLQYMRNRYYNPQTGAFTQQDPIGLAGGLNTYGFANGDPVTYNDPYGLCPKCGDEAVQQWAQKANNSDGVEKAAATTMGLFAALWTSDTWKETALTLTPEFAVAGGGRAIAAYRAYRAGRAGRAANAAGRTAEWFAPAAHETRVSRWMGDAEATAMLQSGTLQLPASGRSYVTLPGAPRPGATRSDPGRLQCPHIRFTDGGKSSLASDHPERSKCAGDWDCESYTMSVLYGAFLSQGIETAACAMDALSAAYPGLTLKVGRSAIQLSTDIVEVAIKRIQTSDQIVGTTSEGVGFDTRHHTQESVGLCWDALQALSLEFSCPVWISEEMYTATDISEYAEPRRVQLTSGEYGFVLEPSEFESLIGLGA